MDGIGNDSSDDDSSSEEDEEQEEEKGAHKRKSKKRKAAFSEADREELEGIGGEDEDEDGVAAGGKVCNWRPRSALFPKRFNRNTNRL